MVGDFDGKSSFWSWLYRIVVNCSSNLLRPRNRRDRAGGITFHLSLGGDSERDVQIGDLMEAVLKAFAQLPEKRRLALILSRYEELSSPQSGLILRCSAESVRSKFYQALRKLRGRLGPYL
ncbi:MAG: sigma-70 family RNA polymerase sigma factor [Candidatus Latescibacteria bacterium]|nr:sigma-70 family RNA polymerase sigma factor [Candidatus Latescibacterota bacterium]